MTKVLLSITITALTIITFGGCSNEPKPAEEVQVTAPTIEKFGCTQEDVKAPKWTCIPGVDGFYSGVGIAPYSAAGMGHMRKVAVANGRSDLAQQIKSQVKDKIEVFTQTTGDGERETVDRVTTAVSKQLAKVNLQGSKGIDVWTAPSGALYMLVTVPKSSINKEVKKAVTSSFQSDDALWQQFKSQQALEALDNEFPSE